MDPQEIWHEEWSMSAAVILKTANYKDYFWYLQKGETKIYKVVHMAQWWTACTALRDYSSDPRPHSRGS